MPRYFFNISDGVRETDAEGTELSSFDDARIQAIKLAGAVLNESPEHIANGDNFRVEVTDDRGLSKFTVLTLTMQSFAPPSETQGANTLSGPFPPSG